MPQVGTGAYTYELIRDWPKMPKGESLGVVSRVATDSQDRVYVFQRKDPPVVVFDRVRENLKKGRKVPLYDLLNQSVNETLPRTVMTGSTTLACLLALLIFGGDQAGHRQALQERGLIRYSRGVIEILDRTGLTDVACPCYRIVRDEFDKLLGVPAG